MGARSAACIGLVWASCSRALKAASMVETEAHALALSQPLGLGRDPELNEILGELFSGL